LQRPTAYRSQTATARRSRQPDRGGIAADRLPYGTAYGLETIHRPMLNEVIDDRRRLLG
jgi:hypothetical protein